MPRTTSVSKGKSVLNETPKISSQGRRRRDLFSESITEEVKELDEYDKDKVTIVDETVLSSSPLLIPFTPPKATYSSSKKLTSESRNKRNNQRKRKKINDNDDVRFMPSSINATAVAVVTPPKCKKNFKHTADESDVAPTSSRGGNRSEENLITGISGGYVPTHLHSCLDYTRAVTTATDIERTKAQRTCDLIQRYYFVPADLEQNRNTYGPLSGTSYEDRVIGAYLLNKLTPRENTPTNFNSIRICTECVDIGHVRDDCPALLLV